MDETSVASLPIASWQPRRLAAVEVELPEGVTPPGTRGRILHAALALFSEYGFHGTSIRQIAARVDINPATLYAHYPSKEHILAELVLIGHQELYARLRTAQAAAGTDPAARLPSRTPSAGSCWSTADCRRRSRPAPTSMSCSKSASGRPWPG